MNAPLRVILLGPPGAGKGTQAEMIAARYHAAHVSTGDILRAAVKKRTALGLEAKRYMDRGQLVPDATVIGMVDERLAEPDAARGFVLDGFPRTVEQATALGAIAQRRGYSIAPVINLLVPREDVVKRLSGRRVCRECGAMYHLILAPRPTPDCATAAMASSISGTTTMRTRSWRVWTCMPGRPTRWCSTIATWVSSPR